MTAKNLIKKYEQMLKNKYETVYISQVIHDLRQCYRPSELHSTANTKEKNERENN